jgi:NAD(P)H-hydrate epimerase
MQLPAQLLRKETEVHKGDCGHLFVVGASRGLSGAACLCASAAMRSGAGLVTVGVPMSLNYIFELKLTEVMSLPLAETKVKSLSRKSYPEISNFVNKANALALGCGASRDKSTVRLMLKAIKNINRPQVIDADAINALSKSKRVLKKRKNNRLIITPHLGEFSRLTGEPVDAIKKERKLLAKSFALRYNLVLVLKGPQTIVTDGKQLFENFTGNPGMATAGSGDVLTGIIGALLAQGVASFQAAKAAVYLHGLAADIAVANSAKAGLIASDIINFIPLAIRRSI